ncbi:J domain-containing protein [Candidatus Viridilinea mediisalina]|uniref:J domain-containing protein n=1 Tax=Candidatus Viridilinea mediisalina TaxID=2024553 RepID=A0A2A6RGH6_9CHLR|nr:J domain-containing protein [Candidatus Viridilinea mediisalina]PDW01985.1 hypothetical protein CJ255_16375 [Candidatus Viridilinea mediisalina]
MDDFEQLDYYTLLELARNATADEIKRAYRRQMALYHPDRFAGAAPDAQAYASRRAQRINEAYAVLTDFSARVTYNRSLPDPATAPPQPAPARTPRTGAPQQPASRDQLAELYDQAQAHMVAGRYNEALHLLREIVQISPFYRDSSALLARAEAVVAHARPAAAQVPDRRRRALMFGGVGALLLAGLGAAGWAVRRPFVGTDPQATPAAVGVATQPSETATAQAEAAAPAPAEATATPSPTAAPSATPTTTPQPSPTMRPATPTPTLIPEQGRIIYSADFSTAQGWPITSGRGWSVGLAANGYQIVAIDGAGHIWAYRTSPAGMEYLVGVDVQIEGGMAGLMLRFQEREYLAFFINPQQGNYRLEQRLASGPNVLAEERSSAIKRGATAENRLVARLEGNTIALRINGQAIFERDLTTPPPSIHYGLVAVAQGSTCTATFRNLAIRELT